MGEIFIDLTSDNEEEKEEVKERIILSVGKFNPHHLWIVFSISPNVRLISSLR